jgi:chromosome segregation ATPase
LLPALAQTDDPAPATQAEETDASQPSAAQSEQTIRRLQTIKSVLEDRREQVRALLEQLAVADELSKAKIREQITELQQRIRELTDSFERTASNGVNLRNLDETEDKKFDWHQELALIARPVIDGLKSATEKPRRIAELQTSISLYRQQLEATRKALEALSQLEQQDIPTEVAGGVAEVGASWRQRNTEIEQSLIAAQEELKFLETAESRMFETVGSAVYEFIVVPDARAASAGSQQATIRTRPAAGGADSAAGLRLPFTDYSAGCVRRPVGILPARRCVATVAGDYRPGDAGAGCLAIPAGLRPRGPPAVECGRRARR